jgi:acylphosphatase
MDKRAQIIITGRVQGVFFRDYTRENAIKLGLNGWVKNLAAGHVAAVVEGEEDRIEKLIELLKKGPPAARIKDVKVVWQKPENEFDDFTIHW